MIQRTITLAGRPNVQIQLFFSSRSNAEKAPLSTNIEGEKNFVDDYKHRVIIGKDSVIISDLITDANQMFEVNAEMEVMKLKASKKLQERIDNDPLLKMWVATQQRNQQMKQMGQGMVLPQ